MTSPFENNHATPWNKHFIDLPELNAHASDGIATAVQRVRQSARGERQDIESASLLVLGPAGVGKTHLFMRLRRKLGPRAVFVHLRPLIGAEMTPRYVLGELVAQLDYESASEGGTFRQLDALVGAAFAYLQLDPIHLPQAQLDHFRTLDETALHNQIEWAIEQIAQRHPEVDDTYARRLLEVPFMRTMAQRRASLAWLSGRELEQAQLDRLGVKAGLAEEHIVRALQTLALFATPGAPIVLVFDQLENLMDPATTGERVRAYANLVAELFDTMRGVVLVQMALDTEWAAAILPQLSQTQKTRLDSERYILKLPTAPEKRELVRLWLEQLPDSSAPFPAPFGEGRLRAWCETVGMTPRMLMIECRQALEGGEEAAEVETTGPDTSRMPDDDATALEVAWAEHLARARTALDDAGKDRRAADSARLVGGITTSLRLLNGSKHVSVSPHAPLQVHLEHAGQAWGVALVQQMHPRAVGAALDRAREATSHAKVLAVREQALEFPPTWKQTLGRLAAFRAAGGRWLQLQREDAACLLALESFVSAARSGDVEGQSGRALGEQVVTEWIQQVLSLNQWAIARVVGEQSEVEAPSEMDAVPAPGTRPSVEASVVETCITRLRMAALDRLIREVARVRKGSTRADVLAGLEGMKDRVEWFGRSIVALRTERS
jgi:hypothetical protein